MFSGSAAFRACCCSPRNSSRWCAILSALRPPRQAQHERCCHTHQHCRLHCEPDMSDLLAVQLFYSFFKTLVGKEVVVELKNGTA